MYITIDEAEYTAIRGLKFVPSADLVGASLPINEFQVDLLTADDIAIGNYAELRDDAGTLWAHYWIVYAERVDAGTVRIRAQSEVLMLDRVTLPAIYLEAADVGDVLDDTIVQGSGAEGVVIPLDYTLDSSFDGETITGFCPEQTARERLLWLCFTIGGYVKTFFNDRIEILPIDDAEALIPLGDIYWKPTLYYNDWVTAVTVKRYSFTPGTPQATDRYVEDRNGNYYIVTEQTATLRNPSAPGAAPENVVSIDGVYLVNAQNVSVLLSRLALWYFKRTAMELDAIDNAAYIPGDRVIAYGDAQSLYTGYIESCDFAFGVQARARLRLTAVEVTDAARLIVTYTWDEMTLGVDRYTLPVGFAYDIQTRYIDQTLGPHRYIFRPTMARVTGTLTADGVEAEMPCLPALDHFESVLELISVDSLTDDEGVVEIS